MNWSLTWVICVLLVITVILQNKTVLSETECKELNQINCYSGQNVGYFCNKNEPSSIEVRWYYDKGQCKTFLYRGCYGNRNRFCSKQACERRCSGE